MVGAVKLMRPRPRVARMRYGSIRWPTLIATQVPQRVLKTRSRTALNGICWVAGSNGRTAIERTLPDAHARDEPLRSRNSEPKGAVCSRCGVPRGCGSDSVRPRRRHRGGPQRRWVTGTRISSLPVRSLSCVSERTLLPVLIPARDTGRLVPRLREAVGQMLRELGVADAAVAAEKAAMLDAAIGKTTSRQLLGSLNDFVRMLGSYRGAGTLLDVSLRLAETPCGPLRMNSPREDTIRAFGAARVTGG